MNLRHAFRTLDDALTGRGAVRRVLVDGRTPVNYEMVAPVVSAMATDARVQFSFTASDDPQRLQAIYHRAPPHTRLVTSRRAALGKWDAYLASDFMWATLPRGTRRIQMFHGVGGKYGFDAPTESMRMWDRLLFANARRLRNFIRAGAIDPDASRARLTGMPKVDCLVNGTLSQSDILAALNLDATRPTVLYAPTWSRHSSLHQVGVAIIERLATLPVNLLVKLHDRSCDPDPHYSGGVDWLARLSPLLATSHTRLVTDPNITRALAAADAMITDHSSCGFEYLLLNRPLVRIHIPELVAGANVHPDYVQLLADAAHNVTLGGGAPAVVQAVERALADPAALSASRRRVAADLFHEPGHATSRCVAALYEVLELDPAAATGREPVRCLQSA